MLQILRGVIGAELPEGRAGFIFFANFAGRINGAAHDVNLARSAAQAIGCQFGVVLHGGIHVHHDAILHATRKLGIMGVQHGAIWLNGGYISACGHNAGIAVIYNAVCSQHMVALPDLDIASPGNGVLNIVIVNLVGLKGCRFIGRCRAAGIKMHHLRAELRVRMFGQAEKKARGHAPQCGGRTEGGTTAQQRAAERPAGHGQSAILQMKQQRNSQTQPSQRRRPCSQHWRKCPRITELLCNLGYGEKQKTSRNARPDHAGNASAP